MAASLYNPLEAAVRKGGLPPLRPKLDLKFGSPFSNPSEKRASPPFPILTASESHNSHQQGVDKNKRAVQLEPPQLFFTGSFLARIVTSSCPPLPAFTNASFKRPSASISTCVATEHEAIS